MIKENRKGSRYLIHLTLLAILVLFASPNIAKAADTYEIDTSHSSLGFAVKHLTVSTVKGEFTDYSGSIQFNKSDSQSFVADVSIKAASIDTHNVKRDEHLKSADFFDSEKYKTISFKSKSLTAQPNDDYVLVGDLTMHGVTKEISIPVSISGPVKSPFGSDVIGLSGETSINRQDFGISWNKTLDAGGYVLGDDVKILINIEASKK